MRSNEAGGPLEHWVLFDASGEIRLGLMGFLDGFCCNFVNLYIKWISLNMYIIMVWNSTSVRPLLLLVSACTAASISLLAQHGSYWKTLSQNAQFSSEHFFVSVITTLQIFNWAQSRPRCTLYTAAQLGQQFSKYFCMFLMPYPISM